MFYTCLSFCPPGGGEAMHHRSHDQPPGGGLYPGRGWADPPAGTRKVGSMHPTGILSLLYAKFLHLSVILFTGGRFAPLGRHPLTP